MQLEEYCRVAIRLHRGLDVDMDTFSRFVRELPNPQVLLDRYDLRKVWSLFPNWWVQFLRTYDRIHFVLAESAECAFIDYECDIAGLEDVNGAMMTEVQVSYENHREKFGFADEVRKFLDAAEWKIYRHVMEQPLVSKNMSNFDKFVQRQKIFEFPAAPGAGLVLQSLAEAAANASDSVPAMVGRREIVHAEDPDIPWVLVKTVPLPKDGFGKIFRANPDAILSGGSCVALYYDDDQLNDGSDIDFYTQDPARLDATILSMNFVRMSSASKYVDGSVISYRLNTRARARSPVFLSESESMKLIPAGVCTGYPYYAGGPTCRDLSVEFEAAERDYADGGSNWYRLEESLSTMAVTSYNGGTGSVEGLAYKRKSIDVIYTACDPREYIRKNFDLNVCKMYGQIARSDPDGDYDTIEIYALHPRELENKILRFSFHPDMNICPSAIEKIAYRRHKYARRYKMNVVPGSEVKFITYRATGAPLFTRQAMFAKSLLSGTGNRNYDFIERVTFPSIERIVDRDARTVVVPGIGRASWSHENPRALVVGEVEGASLNLPALFFELFAFARELGCRVLCVMGMTARTFDDGHAPRLWRKEYVLTDLSEIPVRKLHLSPTLQPNGNDLWFDLSGRNDQ
jgi:hypothetical protein